MIYGNGMKTPMLMTTHLPIYAPNISTESLIELLAIQLGEDFSLISVERIERKVRFRSPEFTITVDSTAPWLKAMVIKELINAARMLGATQFTFEHNGFSMRRQPTNLPPEKIEHLLIASYNYDPMQVNIF